jgi:hypothetical protein
VRKARMVTSCSDCRSRKPWDRDGFRQYWRWKSRLKGSQRPRVPEGNLDLIRQMSLVDSLCVKRECSLRSYPSIATKLTVHDRHTIRHRPGRKAEGGVGVAGAADHCAVIRFGRPDAKHLSLMKDPSRMAPV